MSFKHTPEQARKAWTDALRSGNFQQCKGALCAIKDEQRRYCCLGVACEVFLNLEGDKHFPVKLEPFELPEEESLPKNLNYGGHTGDLPTEVRRWVGLETNSGCYRIADAGDFTSLINLNDNQEFTFAQIADVIDSNPPGLLAPVPTNGILEVLQTPVS